ncbi:hypothetical protein [Micromonospora hortensis]|uniref:hypothetical protein n=1 Tax=Micromonospora hortensis TaxID=2911209 RepID=UPI001EE850AA|nr:hypothetical protein [Micromonospora hortensis]MCG5451834.1 hypothetical protein [Micromonospora hortensis]
MSNHRGRPGKLPPGTAAMLADFARYEWYGERSGIGPEQAWGMLSTLLPLSQSDPAGLTAALAWEVTPQGGWSAYGASRAVAELLGLGFEGDDAKVVLDGGIRFLRQNGVPPLRVRGYEWNRWVDTGGDVTNWLPTIPPPPPERSGLRELAPGEVRHVATLTADRDSNTLHVCRDDSGAYLALIDARYSDEDPTRSRSQWKQAASLYEVFVNVGLALQSPPHWVSAELEPYIPLPRPSI